MNKKNNKVLFTLAVVAVIAVGLVTILGGPINPTGGVQTFLSLIGR